MSFIVQAPGLSLNVCSCCLAEAGVRLKKRFKTSSERVKKKLNKTINDFKNETQSYIFHKELIRTVFLQKNVKKVTPSGIPTKHFSGASCFSIRPTVEGPRVCVPGLALGSGDKDKAHGRCSVLERQPFIGKADPGCK